MTRTQQGIAWRVGLSVAFALVQVLALALGWSMPNQPMGDVYNVYEPWAHLALNGHIMGVAEPWVYPPLAIVPMLVPALTGGANYTLAWGLLIVILNLAVFVLLIGDGLSRPRRAAAIFWLAFALAIGPIAIYRIDGITVPLAVIAVLLIGRWPAVAATLLAAGAWIKIWPGAMLLAAYAALRRRLGVLIAAAAVSAAVCVAVIAAGGAGSLFGFLSAQSDRGLQLEAPISTGYLWAAVAAAPGAGIVYNADIVTFQVSGAGTALVSVIMTPLLVLFAAALAVWGLLLLTSGVRAERLLPPLALAEVLVFIVCNKVGSPQFEVWLIAPIVLWLLWQRRAAAPYAAGAIVIALLTMLVYPLMYDRLTAAAPDAALVLTLRNALLVGMLVAVLVHLLRLRPVRQPGDTVGITHR